MALLDFILNLAGLLLWLNWRFLRVARKARVVPGVSLAGTVKSTQPSRVVPWPGLAFLGGLLLVRAFVYSTIGSNLRTNMVLDLGILSVSFNPFLMSRMLLFSILSFISFTAVFYFLLLLLSALNRSAADPDPCLRWIRMHLGWLERRHPAIKCGIPFVAGLLFWMLAGGVLASLGLLPGGDGFGGKVLRGCVFGISMYWVWLPVLIFLAGFHIISSYVYLGELSWVSFLQRSGRNLMSLFPKLQMVSLRTDFTPWVLILLLSWMVWNGCQSGLCGGGVLLIRLWHSI